MFSHRLTEYVLAEKMNQGNKDTPVKPLLPTAPVRLCGLRAGMGSGEWLGEVRGGTKVF